MSDGEKSPNPIIARCTVPVGGSCGEVLAHQINASVFEDGTVVFVFSSALGGHHSQVHITEDGLEKFLLEAARTLQAARALRDMRDLDKRRALTRTLTRTLR